MFEEIGIDFLGCFRMACMEQREAWSGAFGSARRGRPGRGFFTKVPQAAVLEVFLDHVALIGLDEGDDLHGPAALGAQKRIDVVNLLDKHGPAAAVGPASRGCLAGLRLGVCGGIIRPGGGRGFLGPHAPSLVGVVAVIADEVLAFVRNMLDDLRQEIERFKDMEVSGRAGCKYFAGRNGEVLRCVLFRAIDDMACRCDFHESGEAERAASHVFRQTLNTVAVSGAKADAAVHAEAAMTPGSHLGDQGGLDASRVQKQGEYGVFPELEERLVAEVDGEMEKAAVGGESAISDKGVNVRMKMKQLSEGLYGKNAAGDGGFVAQQRAVDGLDRLPCQAGQLAEEVSVVAKEDTQALGDGPDELAMRDVEADALGDVEAKEDGAFL